MPARGLRRCSASGDDQSPVTAMAPRRRRDVLFTRVSLSVGICLAIAETIRWVSGVPVDQRVLLYCCRGERLLGSVAVQPLLDVGFDTNDLSLVDRDENRAELHSSNGLEDLFETASLGCSVVAGACPVVMAHSYRSVIGVSTDVRGEPQAPGGTRLTFPVVVLGSSSTRVIVLGHLCGARWPRAQILSDSGSGRSAWDGEDQSPHLLAPLGVVDAVNERLGHLGMAHQGLLDLSGIDVDAPADDELSRPSHEVEVAVAVQATEVTHRECVAVPDGGGGIFVPPVLEALRTRDRAATRRQPHRFPPALPSPCP